MTYDEEKRRETYEARRERLSEALEEFIEERKKEFWGDEERSWHREIVVGMIQEVVGRLK